MHSEIAMVPLKILHLITGLHVGGAETMLAKLVARMDRARFSNVVVSLIEPGPIAERIRESGIAVLSLGMKRGVPTPAALIRLARILRKHKPAVLQTWLYHADLLGLICGKLAGIRHILWNLRCSDMLAHSSRSTVLTCKACASLSRWPDAVISNSEAGRALHVSLGYRPRRWLLIPNGFDLKRFAPDAASRLSVRTELGLSASTLLIGLIGRYDPMKDHANFLQAARLLGRGHPDVHFLLAGRDVTSSNPDLSRMIKEYDVASAVHLLGERSDVAQLMAALDMATSSSAYGEGFGNIIGEAMACAVPCVVTDVGDSAAIVGDTGAVVAPRDSEGLAGAWKRLIEAGPEARQRLGESARLRVQENYSLERIVRRYEELYLSLA